MSLPEAVASFVASAPADFDERQLAIYLGAVGLVILVAGLVSGVVERGPISQVAVFVALGVLIGPWGLDVVELSVVSPAVQTVATISLVLIFFTDAIKINLGQLRTNWLVPALALGPGALATIVLIAGAAKIALDLSWSMSFLLAAILASTDPVLLRDVISNRHVPRSVRHTLSVEAGTNDAIVLPLVLAMISVALGERRGVSGWLGFVLDLTLLGPAIGVVVAVIAIRAMAWLRRREMIRREYEAIYSIGVSFVAYAAAQLAGGSGFLAAFAAGIAIALLDEELCDCFLEYGETTAEMAMLLTFVFVGAALVEAAQNGFSIATVLFATFVLAVARPAPFLALLRHTHLSTAGRAMIAWFGPRGLPSILLAVIAVAEGVPQPGRLFEIVGIVVVASMVAHGASATPVLAWYGRYLRARDTPEETALDSAGIFEEEPARLGEAPRFTVDELQELMSRGDGVTIVDVRRQSAFARERAAIPGSLRIPLDELDERLAELPRGRPIVLWCT